MANIFDVLHQERARALEVAARKVSKLSAPVRLQLEQTTRQRIAIAAWVMRAAGDNPALRHSIIMDTAILDTIRAVTSTQ